MLVCQRKLSPELLDCAGAVHCWPSGCPGFLSSQTLILLGVHIPVHLHLHLLLLLMLQWKLELRNGRLNSWLPGDLLF